MMRSSQQVASLASGPGYVVGDSDDLISILLLAHAFSLSIYLFLRRCACTIMIFRSRCIPQTRYINARPNHEGRLQR
jgi:hypothetical protein